MVANVLSHVLRVGREAASMPGRGMAAIGNRANEALESMKLRHYHNIMDRKLAQADFLTRRKALQDIGLDPSTVPQYEWDPNLYDVSGLTNDQRELYENSRQVLFNNEANLIRDRAERQAAILPDTLRFAGKAVVSPIALVGYGGIGGYQLAKHNLLTQLGGAPNDPNMTNAQMSFRLENAGLYGVPEEEQFSPQQLAVMRIASIKNSGILPADLDYNAL